MDLFSPSTFFPPKMFLLWDLVYEHRFFCRTRSGWCFLPRVFLCTGSQHAAEYKTKLWKPGVSIALRCIRCWCHFINLMFSNSMKSLKQIGELICTTCTRYIWWTCSWNCLFVLSVCFSPQNQICSVLVCMEFNLRTFGLVALISLRYSICCIIIRDI